MSAEATGYVWARSPYKGATLLVHLAIADVANDLHEQKFWMAMPALARKCRVTVRAAQLAVACLVRDGYLDIDAPHDALRWQPTTYRFVFKDFTPGERTSPPPGELRSPPLVNDVRPIPIQRSQSEQPKDLGFEKFWTEYPKKRHKPDARKAWKQVEADAHQLVIHAGLVAWVKSEAWQRGFIEDPATFLRQRQWEDPPPAAKRQGTGGALPPTVNYTQLRLEAERAAARRSQ